MDKHKANFEKVTGELADQAATRVKENINDISAAVAEFEMLGVDCLEVINVAKSAGVSLEFINKIMDSNRKKLECYTSLNS